jgi:hypothetical protein
MRIALNLLYLSLGLRNSFRLFMTNFHVRITAPPFNDGSGANDLVWNEASDQARALMVRIALNLLYLSLGLRNSFRLFMTSQLMSASAV